MAISRFDQRREIVVEEANDLQTTYMRSQLLNDPYAAESAQLLREYLDSRIAFYEAGTNEEAIKSSLALTDGLQTRLWQIALAAARDNPDEVRTGYYIESLNNLIEDHTKRVAAMSNHVPDVIMHLLFFVAVMSIGVTGYSSGMHGKRLRVLRMILITLVAATLIVIVDLDRPRRGFIKVSVVQLLKLQQKAKSFNVPK